MGAPVVKSTNGYGLPVTVVDKGGLPVALASNGYGTPIIEVAQGGLPITYDQGGGGVTYDPLVQTWLSRRANNPNDAYKKAVNDTVVALRTGGYLPKLTGLYFWRDPQSRDDARLNVMAAANDLTESGTLTFEAGKGFTADASSYLDTGYVVPAGSRNDFHAGMHTDTSAAKASADDMGTDGNFRLQARTSPGNGGLFRINSGTNAIVGVTILNAIGHHILSRTGASLSAWYHGGALRLSGNNASVAPSGVSLRFLGNSAVASSARRATFGHFGAGLSAVEAQAISDIIYQNYTRPLGESVVAYGDSLTLGTGSTAGNEWPTKLAASIGRVVFNGGVGGQGTAQIKSRFDADMGAPGCATILWCGRNDVAADMASIILPGVAAMYAAAEAKNPGRTIIIGVTNGWMGTEGVGSDALGWITDYNAQAAAIYQNRFIDMYAYLYGLGAPGQPYADPTAYANGLIPTAFRGDSTVHFNNTAYNIIGNVVYAKGQQLVMWP